ncbi:hypothetical protein [Streptomyces sp. NPDC058653]|uniref:hypothetical protein n=1 Tax=Streptomyces sp. NPDC058653 TaxID=3346576 RepID=UPI00365879D5
METIHKPGPDTAISAALTRWCKPRAMQDPGRILLDLAPAVALDGDCSSGIGVLRTEHVVLRPAASDPTVSRLVETQAAADSSAPTAVRRARAEVRERVWKLSGSNVPDAGGEVIVEIARVLVLAHSEKRNVLATRKIISTDSASGIDDFVNWLTTWGRWLSYLVGMTITDAVHHALLQVPHRPAELQRRSSPGSRSASTSRGNRRRIRRVVPAVTEEREQHCVGLSPTVSAAARNGSLALAAVASWSDLLLVVQGRVLPGWGVSATLLILALVLRRTLTRVGSPAGAPKLPRKRATWASLGNTLLIAMAVLGTVWGAADDLISSAEYHVLRPAGPGGCTAVVRETSFLMIGNGEAYAVGLTGLALGESGSWTVDDGYRPVDAGTYELGWERDSGLLRVSGTSTDPVVRGGSADIHCGW